MEDGDSDTENLEIDYYAVLNVSRDATTNEIEKAFRQLSRKFHPDRHTDLECKRLAEEQFRRLQVAFDVLVDPNRRAIFDTVGARALHVQGWEVIPQIFNPNQVRDEFRRLKRLKEINEQLEQTQPTAEYSVHVNVTDFFRPSNQILIYEDENHDEYCDINSSNSTSLGDYLRIHPIGEWPFEVSVVSATQSVECRLGNTRLIGQGSVFAKNGTGSGAGSLTARSSLNDRMYSETTLALGEENIVCNWKLTRQFNQRTNFFITPQLCYNIMPNTFIPGIQFGISRQLDYWMTGMISVRLGLQQSMTTTLIYNDFSRSHASLGLTIGLPHSYLSLSINNNQIDYNDDSDFESSFHRVKADTTHYLVTKVGTMGVFLSAGIEARISKYSRAGTSIQAAYPTGALKVRFNLLRASHSYAFELMLCDSVDYFPHASLYGVFIPAIASVLLYNLTQPLWQKYFTSFSSSSLAKRRELFQKRKENAENALKLMRESAEKCRAREEKTNGLVIKQARYGKLFRTVTGTSNQFNEQSLDVTVQLQSLVADSKLIIAEVIKAQLPGFYDPCPGDEKLLFIQYDYRMKAHSVTLKDDEPVYLPKRSHMQLQ